MESRKKENKRDTTWEDGKVCREKDTNPV